MIVNNNNNNNSFFSIANLINNFVNKIIKKMRQCLIKTL